MFRFELPRKKRFVRISPFYYLLLERVVEVTPHYPVDKDETKGVWLECAGLSRIFVPVEAIDQCDDKELRNVMLEVAKASLTPEENLQRTEDKETEFGTQRDGDASSRAEHREDDVAVSDSVEPRNTGD